MSVQMRSLLLAAIVAVFGVKLAQRAEPPLTITISVAINGGRSEPIVEFGSHPIGNRNRPNVASLANQIDNGTMLFALLEMIQCQSHGFMPPQLTREYHCQQSSFTFPFESLKIGCLPKRIALLPR